MADLSVVAPKVQALTGIEDIGKVVQVYTQNKGFFDMLFGLVKGWLAHRSDPATVPAPPPVTLTPPPVVIPPPVSAPVVPGTVDDVKRLQARLAFVEKARRNAVSGQRGELEDLPRFTEILAGANIDDGSWLHTDCTPFADSGTEIAPDDPRWPTLNHSFPNGNVVFPYYRFNGKLTKITEGDHGSGEVEPGSFADDQGCTVTYKINGKGKFEFGYLARRHDGTLVDSGLVGPFNVA
jgi:hypothetical protein